MVRGFAVSLFVGIFAFGYFWWMNRLGRTAMKRQPVLFIGHGGGPMFLLDSKNPMFGAGDKTSSTVRELTSIWGKLYGKDGLGLEKPSAILVVSAHWESNLSDRSVEVLGFPDPQNTSLFFDYYGFPKETYDYKYPCPSDEALNEKIVQVLNENGLKASMSVGKRDGYDHGVFIPLLTVYPKADIPVAQVSLNGRLNPKTHFQLGTALSKLRDEGVLIIGSGMTTHNMREVHPSSDENLVEGWAAKFQAWLDNTLLSGDLKPAARMKLLEKWESDAPESLRAHPRSEHLLPIHVCAAAAGFEKADKPFQYWMAKTFALNMYIWE